MDEIYYWVVYFVWTFIILITGGVIISVCEIIVSRVNKRFESATLVNTDTRPPIDFDYNEIKIGDKTHYFKKGHLEWEDDKKERVVFKMGADPHTHDLQFPRLIKDFGSYYNNIKAGIVYRKCITSGRVDLANKIAAKYKLDKIQDDRVMAFAISLQAERLQKEKQIKFQRLAPRQIKNCDLCGKYDGCQGVDEMIKCPNYK